MSAQNPPARRRVVPTSHGSIAMVEQGERGQPVLFIHGNSSCSAVFDAQLTSGLAEEHRLIAIDLPGHGDSSNAFDPAGSYTRPGLAEAACEVLEHMGIDAPVVVGWSLGGHIALELMAHSSSIRGVMIIGAPPIAPDRWAEGFIRSPHSSLAASPHWSPEERDAFLSRIYGRMPEQSLRAAAVRADGRMRKQVFDAARAGAGVDQRYMAETSKVPLAVVNGGADPLVNLGYFDTLSYANLWEGRCHRLAHLGHAPFWEAPAIFAPLLARFLRDIQTARVRKVI